MRYRAAGSAFVIHKTFISERKIFLSNTIQRGEIWQLGKHRLMCGDSTDMSNILRLANDEPIQMILTDPPYKMDYSGGGCFKNEVENTKRRIANMIDFEADVISFYTHMDIPSVYIFTSKALIRDYLNIFKDYNSTILVWCKTNPTPFVGSSFLPDLEYLLYFSKSGGHKVWNKGLKPMSTYSRYFVSAKEEGRRGAGNLHPTMKPLKMLESKILVSSTEGGVVFDGFGGSGSTLIACENTGRRCFMMEREPEYCGVIIRRWEQLTGNKAKKEISGG